MVSLVGIGGLQNYGLYSQNAFFVVAYERAPPWKAFPALRCFVCGRGLGPKPTRVGNSVMLKWIQCLDWNQYGDLERNLKQRIRRANIESILFVAVQSMIAKNIIYAIFFSI
jgi:hypothetical protein